MHVGPPRRDRDLDDRTGAGREEAEPAEHALDLGEGEFEAGETAHLLKREINHAVGDMNLAAGCDSRRCSAADVEDHPGREFEARHHEGGVNPALEAVPRIGIDVQLAAGVGDVDFVP